MTTANSRLPPGMPKAATTRSASSSTLSSKKSAVDTPATTDEPTTDTDELDAKTEAIDINADDLKVPDDPNSESGKFKQLFGILKKAINVADLSNLRISLPANLMEPIANLEYWQYAERPDFFAAMSEPDDELERMMAVLRWTFTKDLKFVKAKIAKPYNSILGEHFHCYWDIDPVTIHPEEGVPEPVHHLDENPSPEVLAAACRKQRPNLPSASSKSSIKSSGASTKSGKRKAGSSDPDGDGVKTRVVFLNEQVSHHPPISHFVLEARGPKGTVIARGADQVGAKFTGTSVKVFPGPHNKGIFVSLPDRGNEEYQITHPTATVAGILRGNPYATIGETTIVTLTGSESGKRLRAIIAYTDEGWISKPKFQLEGVVYEYEEGKEGQCTKIKQVPKDTVLATFEGCWRGEIRWKRMGEDTSKTLVDLIPLSAVPKTVAPIEEQDKLETRRVWSEVTKALLAKDYNKASKAKQELEQAQRNKAEERKKSGEVYEPAYFEREGEEWDGRPRLSEKGKEEIEKQFKASY